MRTERRGYTLIELLAALAIGSLMAVGVTALINNVIDDSKGQQAALHQAQVARAASKYINANYATLLGAATATKPAVVDVATLKSAQLLSAGFQLVNSYGQTPCVLILQPSSGKLDALVVTEGGVGIAAKDVPLIAAHAGEGGGFVPAATPAIAQGAFNAWSVPLASFVQRSCTGTAAGPGHLASALFFDGPGNLAFEYLHRNPVPGHPELNRMNAPLHMNAKATENTSDTLCIVGDALTHGRIAVDNNGKVLSCQGGVWKSQGSMFWKDPVVTFAALPSTGNNVGDVRVVSNLSRGFTWNGTGWVALAVDQNGNFLVPGTVSANKLQVNEIVAKNGTCGANGTIARDATGLPLVCQSGRYRSLLETRITATAFDRDFTFRPGGGVRDFRIDLAPMPGPRPLYITGFMYCNTNGDVRAWLAVEIMDAADNLLGYAGGCGARSDAGGGRVLTKGMIGLQKVPENAARIRVYAEPGALAADYSFLQLNLMNSE